MFYPLHYVVAAFDTPERAEDVRKTLIDAGFDDSDVASATGPVRHAEARVDGRPDLAREVQDRLRELSRHRARLLSTDDEKLAERGAGFLFIHTPDDASIRNAEQLLIARIRCRRERYDHAGSEVIYPAGQVMRC